MLCNHYFSKSPNLLEFVCFTYPVMHRFLMETMAHSVRWRIISEQDTNGFSKLFVCLLKGISTVLPVKPLQFDVEKPPVVDPKIVFFFPHVIFSTKSGVLKFQSLETLRQPYGFSPRGRQWVDGQHLFGYTAENCTYIILYIYVA